MEEPPLYDAIGRTYARTRRPDPRIAALLFDALELATCPPERALLDVGAGTASYAAAIAARGVRVFAVEPSSVMLEQARRRLREAGLADRVELVQATAGAIPSADGAFHAAMGVLSLHHFADPEGSVREIARATRPGGVVAFFTADPREREAVWLDEYFDFLFAGAREVYPPMGELVAMLESASGQPVEVRRFPLPRDTEDLFFLAGWARPRLYLEDDVRAGISHFQRAAATAGGRARVAEATARLACDLESGAWEERHGRRLAGRDAYDGGYRLVSFRR